MVVTVHELLIKPFANRSTEDKVKIIKEGKPRPSIDKKIYFYDKQIYVKDLYNLEVWLTACDKVNGVFCWTCLLFPRAASGQRSFIAKIGDANLYSNIPTHKKSDFHINGNFQFCMFKRRVLDGNPKCDNQLKSSNKQKREILRRIIDVVCILVTQASPPHKVSKDYNILNHEEFNVRTLMLLKNYDVYNITNETINFVTKCPKILTDTMEAIANVMKISIKKEIQLCSYVSFVLSEHSQFEEKSKLSTVLRYVYKGNICERFIELTGFPLHKNANSIMEHIFRLSREFEISSKLLALSCDGAVLLTHDLCSLVATLQKLKPFCLFVPCHFHDFSYVLEQTLSNITECRVFFKCISSMKMFFQNNSEMCDTFNTVTEGKVLDLKHFKLNSFQLLRFFKMYRREFIAFFVHVVKNCDKWNRDDITKAIGFQNILEEYQTVFMLETFYLLSNHVAILSEMLHSCSPENVFDRNILHNIKEVLIKLKNTGFEKLWTFTITEVLEDSNPKTLQAIGEKQTNELHQTFLKIMDCIIEEIKVRFRCVRKLEFLSLLSCENHNKLVISNYQVNKLQHFHGSLIDKEQLVTEINVLCKNGAIFGGKSVYEFMDILMQMDLHNVFKNVYKLAEIILGMPCKPTTPTNEGSSKLDIINSWVTFPKKAETNSLSFLCIEKDYLEYLKSRIEFYDDVMIKLLPGLD